MLDLSIFNLPLDKPIVVAVSGGADSMALLDMLTNTPYKIYASHVNYNKRKTSIRDENIVKEYCKNKGICLEILDLKEKSSGNFQNWARKKRYQFFSDVYKKVGASSLFIAHQQDDLIETYLFHKERNSLAAHIAIQSEDDIFGMHVVRPLLGMSKEDLRQYCVSRGIVYGDDETNFEKVYTRNRLRIDVVNKMDKKEREELLAKIFEEEEKWQQARTKVLEFANKEEISLTDLKSFSSFEQTLLIYEFITSKKSDAYLYLSKRKIIDILKQLNSSKPNIICPISPSFGLVKAYDNLSLKGLNNTVFSYILDDLKEVKTPYFITTFKPSKKLDGIALTVEDFPLVIRSPKPDDRILLKDGSKSLKRLFIDKKIPKLERDSYPIMVNSQGDIIHVSGLYRFYKRKCWQNNLYVLKCTNCDEESGEHGPKD